jgi:hypothetical protein
VGFFGRFSRFVPYFALAYILLGHYRNRTLVNKEEIHMRHAFALILALVCTLSIVAAQTPAAPPAGQQDAQKPSAPSTPAAQSAAGSKVTYTGCLKPGTAADSWTLENAEVASAAGAAKSPGATATSGASKMTIGLNVKPGENIKPHANHKIEVTGTLGKAAGGAASSSSSATPSQTLNVESVKMVAASCP